MLLCIHCLCSAALIFLHSERPVLHRVLAILSAIGLIAILELADTFTFCNCILLFIDERKEEIHG